jgi:hypothetical protein
MRNTPSAASAFCTPYLATSQTATTGLPTFVDPFTIIQDPDLTTPPYYTYYITEPNEETESYLRITDGTPQFLYKPLPLPSHQSYSLRIVTNTYRYVQAPFDTDVTTFKFQQNVGPVCPGTTRVTLLATIATAWYDNSGGVVFCITPTDCSSFQAVPPGNGIFLRYSTTFLVTPAINITASMALSGSGTWAVGENGEPYVAGISSFTLTTN